MIATLMPDTERRLLPVPDYLESIRGSVSEADHRALLEDVPPLQAIFRSGYPMPDGMPELMISTEDRSFIEMQDFACRVVMSTGFMEEALTTCRYANPILRAARHFMVFGDLTVARLRLLWAIGHETVHYVRRHDLMQRHFGDSPEVLQALEWDADLCSAAAVFRLVQRRKPHLAPLRCKLVTLEGLFWTLRVDAERNMPYEGSASHPHSAGRLYDIQSKLAMLHKETDPADVDMIRPETTVHSQRLLAMLMRLEQTYLAASQLRLGDAGASNMYTYAMLNRDAALVLNRHRKWDEMAVFLNSFRVSREVIPNHVAAVIISDNGISVPVNPTKRDECWPGA